MRELKSISLKNINILLVENSEIDALAIAELLSSSLNSINELHHITSLKETHKFLEENPQKIDIILINLVLEDSFGIHTYEQIFHQYSEIPFLVLTDIDDYIVGVNAVKRGAQDYLIKEKIDANILGRCISYSIERKKAEKDIRISEDKYRKLFERSKDAIYMTSSDGDFIDINPSGLSLFGYEVTDLKNLKVADLYVNKEDRDRLRSVLEDRDNVVDYPVKLIKKDGETQLDCILNSMVLFDKHNNLIGYQGIIRDVSDKKKAQQTLIDTLANLDQVNKELSGMNETLEKKVNERTAQLTKEMEIAANQNKEINESIQYAKRIQASILPKIEKVQESFPESFIFYQPKDIVSGDFYWYEKLNNQSLLAVVDCTGHGVPGAFMSIIGYTQLNEIVSEGKISDPGVILMELNKRVNASLNQNKENETNSKDGMELGLISFDKKEMVLEYSGAMRPMFMVKNDELIVIKGDKFSIGGTSRHKKEFTTNKTPIKTGDCFYLFSDGYPDQFGGKRGKKFMARNVSEMLLNIAHLPMQEQGKIVKNTILDWMKNEDQVDDILFTGIKF